MCCSVLQRVAVRCSVLQCAAVCCSVSQCVAVCGSAWQCGTHCYSAFVGCVFSLLVVRSYEQIAMVMCETRRLVGSIKL